MTSWLRDSLMGNRPCPKVSGDHGPLAAPIALDARLPVLILEVYDGVNDSGIDVSLAPRAWLGLLVFE